MSNFTRFNRSSFASTTGKAVYDAGLRDYMIKVYNYMGAALGITGLVSFFISNSPALINLIFGTPLKWVAFLAPFIFVVFLGVKINNISAASAKNYLWIFSGLMGLSLSSIFLIYTGNSIARAFFVTASLFGAMSIYGYTTKKDLTAMGSFMFMGLIGIIIASLVNLFMHSSAMQFAISVLAVIIFTGLAAYDTQKIKNVYYQIAGNSEMLGKAAVMGALSLYMDFINLFINILRLMGDRR